MDTFTFSLSALETANAKKFMVEHAEVCKNKGKYQGAIGEGYTFSFTDTSIGSMALVTCHCGAKLFLSENL